MDIVQEALDSLYNESQDNPEAFVSPDRVTAYLMLKHGQEKPLDEQFRVLYLDNQHRLLADVVEFTGTVNATTVHPRRIVRESLLHNAAAVILSHNHPSGAVSPSAADVGLTRRLRDILEVVDVRVLDHIIVGPGGKSHSLNQSGDM